MDGLVFHADGHRYVLDGEPVVGVTSALKLLSSDDYAMVDPEVLTRKSELGTAVHRLIELDCLGTLDLASLDSVLFPYYFAWRDFLQQSGFDVVLSESKVASRRYRCAGQLDLFGRLNAIPAVIDAKCVVCVMPSTGPQTAAYEALLREWRPDVLPVGSPCRRYALQLRPGVGQGWMLHPFNDPADLRAFLACLSIHQWRASR